MSNRTVFISHRHADRAVADVLREFIEKIGGGRVDVFQSSYEGGGPQVGRLLNAELAAALRRAELVILVYTVDDANWSYCMWEAGVAFDPEASDTRIIVLQCSDATPAPLGDRVRVLAKSENSIGKFVDQLMTSSDFFPDHDEPLTGFPSQHEQVKRATAELASDLAKVAPFEDDEEWPTWPALTLQLGLQDADAVLERLDRDESDEAHLLLLERLMVSEWDKYAPDIFGWPDFPREATLSVIVERIIPDEDRPDWLDCLLEQISRAVAWEFPDCRWTPMVSRRNDRLHIPILTHVRKSSRSRCFTFEVMLPEIQPGEGVGAEMIADG